MANIFIGKIYMKIKTYFNECMVKYQKEKLLGGGSGRHYDIS